MKKTITLALCALLGHTLLSQVNTQSFTASGNFVVPAGITSLTIEVVGAGGTGGGNGGGGGGGGGYAKGVYNVTAGSSIPVTIGAGGAGAVGGTSSAGAFISATGGANGTSVSNPNLGGGGAGGVGTNGTIANYTGGAGGGGYWTYFGGGGGGAAGSVSNGTAGGNTIVYVPGGCLTPGGAGGADGGVPGGSGGKGAGFTDNGCNNTNPAAPGASYGGGGGGGNGNGGPAGIGSAGYCVISWGGCAPPTAPSNITPVLNLSICGSGSATLTASGTGTLTWFTGPTGPGSVGTGTAFVTPVITTTTTYYVEANTCTSSAVRTPVTVSVSPLPTVNVSSSVTSVCAGSQATVNGSGAVTYSWFPYNPATMSFSTGPQTVIQPTATGAYTVAGTDANGCSNATTFTVNYSPLPNLFVSPASSVICVGQTATLTGVGAVTYSWNGVAGSSQFTANPTTNTTYTVTGGNASQCLKTLTVTQVVSVCTALEAQENSKALFTLYPNPANGEFSITANRAMHITVTNELGQLVRSAELSEANHYQCQLKDFAPGIYVVSDSEHTLQQKIIIQK